MTMEEESSPDRHHDGHRLAEMAFEALISEEYKLIAGVYVLSTFHFMSISLSSFYFLLLYFYFFSFCVSLLLSFSVFFFFPIIAFFLFSFFPFSFFIPYCLPYHFSFPPISVFVTNRCKRQVEGSQFSRDAPN